MSPELPLDELSTVFARINGLLLTAEKADQAVSLLAMAAKEAIPGTLGAGVSLIDAQGRKTSSGFTDQLVATADAYQYELGQGPCLTAWASSSTVLVDNVATDGRWPDWSGAVASLPINSVVSTPLIASGDTFGALKIYSDVTDAFDDGSPALLELFAGPAATLLSSIQGVDTPQRISKALTNALQDRDTVNRACGVLMERERVSEEQAMRKLLNRARREAKPLVRICLDVFPEFGTERS